MRKDEAGNECPETLGEYRNLCAALAGTGSAAVKFLDEKIKADPSGASAKVIAPDSLHSINSFYNCLDSKVPSDRI